MDNVSPDRSDPVRSPELVMRCVWDGLRGNRSGEIGLLTSNSAY